MGGSVAEGKEDQLHHYQMGDLVELFLKPEDYTWYWELYATPIGKKTNFWFPAPRAISNITGSPVFQHVLVRRREERARMHDSQVVEEIRNLGKNLRPASLLNRISQINTTVYV